MSKALILHVCANGSESDVLRLADLMKAEHEAQKAVSDIAAAAEHLLTETEKTWR